MPRIQRQSDAFKKGVTDSETKYAQYLQKQGLDYVSQETICLQCGYHGMDLPDSCYNCGRETQDNVAIVDFLVGKYRIVEIDGSIHEKFKQEQKDRIRDRKLSALGYKVFHIRNEEVDKLAKC